MLNSIRYIFQSFMHPESSINLLTPGLEYKQNIFKKIDQILNVENKKWIKRYPI